MPQEDREALLLPPGDQDPNDLVQAGDPCDEFRVLAQGPHHRHGAAVSELQKLLWFELDLVKKEIRHELLVS